MLKKIKNFLDFGSLSEDGNADKTGPHSHEEHRIAAAALMIEAAELDEKRRVEQEAATASTSTESKSADPATTESPPPSLNKPNKPVDAAEEK